MAFTSAGISTGIADKNAGTTYAFTAPGTVGNRLYVLSIELDNLGTVDGDNGEVIGIADTGGQLWYKAAEFSNAQGAAAGGATVALWYTLLNASGWAGTETITVTFSGSVTAKVITGFVFNYDTTKDVLIDQIGTRADDALDAGSITLTPGKGNIQYLFCRATAHETSATTYTAATNYTLNTGIFATSTGAATTNMAGTLECRGLTTGSAESNDPACTAVDHASVFVSFYEGSWAPFIHPAGSEDVASWFPARDDYTPELAAADVSADVVGVMAALGLIVPQVPITDEFIPTLHPASQGSEDVGALFPDRVDYTYENAAGDLVNTDVTAQLAPNQVTGRYTFEGGTLDGDAAQVNTTTGTGASVFESNELMAGGRSAKHYSPQGTPAYFEDATLNTQNRWFIQTDVAFSYYPTLSTSFVTWQRAVAGTIIYPSVGINASGRLVIKSGQATDAVTGAVTIPRDTLVRVDALLERQDSTHVYVLVNLYLDPTNTGSADETISAVITTSGATDTTSPVFGLTPGPVSGFTGDAPNFTDGAMWFDDWRQSTSAFPTPTGTAQAAGARPSLIANQPYFSNQDAVAALFPERTDYTYENAAGDLLNQEITAKLSPTATTARVTFETGTPGLDDSPDWASTSGAAPSTYDNDLVVGTVSDRFYKPGIGSQTQVRRLRISAADELQNRYFAQVDIAFSAWPTTSASFMRWSFINVWPAIGLSPTGRLVLQSDSGIDDVTGTVVIPPDRFVRLDSVWERQSPTSFRLAVQLFLDPTGSVADETLTATFSVSVTDSTAPSFGVVTEAGIGWADAVFWLDDLILSTAGMPAPSGTAQAAGARPSLIANASPFADQDTLAALFPDRVDYTWENAAADLVNTDNVTAFFNPPVPDITDEFIPTLHPSGSEDVSALFPERTDYTYENQAASAVEMAATGGWFGAVVVASAERAANGEGMTAGATVLTTDATPNVYGDAVTGSPTWDNDTAYGAISLRGYAPSGSAFGTKATFSISPPRPTRMFIRSFIRVSGDDGASTVDLLLIAPITGGIRRAAVKAGGILQLRSTTGGELAVSSSGAVPYDSWFRLEMVAEPRGDGTIYQEIRLYVDPTSSTADTTLSATETATFDVVNSIGIGNQQAVPNSAIWWDNVVATAAGWPGWDGSATPTDARISQIVNASPLPSQEYLAALFPDRIEYTYEIAASDITDDIAWSIQAVPVSVTAPIATATATALAPTARYTIAVPTSASTAAGLAPTLKLGATVSAPCATATASALAPAITTGTRSTAPVGTATGDALTPTVAVTVIENHIPSLHPQGSEDVAALFPERTDYTYESAAADVVQDISGWVGAQLAAGSVRSALSETETAGADVGAGTGDPDTFDAVSVQGSNQMTFDNDTAYGGLSIRGYVPDAGGSNNLRSRWQLSTGYGNPSRLWVRAYVRLSTTPTSNFTLLGFGPPTGTVRKVAVTSGTSRQLLLTSGGTSSAVGAVPIDSWFRLEYMVEVLGNGSVYEEARLYLDPTSSTPDTTVSETNANTFTGGVSSIEVGGTSQVGTQIAAWWDDVLTSAIGWPGWDGTATPTDARISQIVNAQRLGTEDTAAQFPDRSDYVYELAASLVSQDVTPLLLSVATSVAPPVATATAAALTPTVTLGVRISAPCAIAAAASLVPTTRYQLTVPIATSTATGLTPTRPLRISAPCGTATATALAPTLRLGARLSAPLATATAGALVPTTRYALTVAIATATAAGLTPTHPLRISAPCATATATALAPTVRYALTVPLATATAAGLSPARPLRVSAPTGTATAAAIAPTTRLGARVSAPLATATASALTPAITLGVRVAAPCGTATAVALTPSARYRLTVAIATATGAGVAPTRPLRIAAPTGAATGTAFAPSLRLGARVLAPCGAATGTALAPNVSLGVRILAPCATATATALAPSVTLGARILSPTATATATAFAPSVPHQVRAPPATATAVAVAPTVSAAARVTAPCATATSAALAPTLTLGARILAPCAAATGTSLAPSFRQTTHPACAAATASAPAPTVAASARILAPCADAAATAFAPTVAQRIVFAVAAIATADAPAPAEESGARADATPALATAQALTPTVAGSARVLAPCASATATALAPAVTASSGTTINAPCASSTAAAVAPNIRLGARVSAPCASATAAGLAPSTRLRTRPGIATATATALVPAISVTSRQLAPVAVVTATALAPTLRLGARQLAPCASATAASLAPTVRLGARVLAPCASATGAGLVPTIRRTASVAAPCALATASALTPSTRLRVRPGSAIATATALAPSITRTVHIQVPCANAAAAAPVPTVATGHIILASTAPASAAALAPTVHIGVRVLAPCAVATGAGLTPTLSLGARIVAPTAAATARALTIALELDRVHLRLRGREDHVLTLPGSAGIPTLRGIWTETSQVVLRGTERHTVLLRGTHAAIVSLPGSTE